MSNTPVRHASAPAPLLPAQQQALEALQRNVAAQHVAVLMGRPGAGKTTLLRALHARLGGAYLTSRDFIEESESGRHPLALDETVYHVLRQALKTNDVVIVDDFQLVSMVSCCTHSYPRQNFLAAALVPRAPLADAALARDAPLRLPRRRIAAAIRGTAALPAAAALRTRAAIALPALAVRAGQ